MEDVIDDLQPEEISDALGLLELFARIGQITPRELKALGRRVEQRRQSLADGQRKKLAVDV
jgi:hypothetical protein